MASDDLLASECSWNGEMTVAQAIDSDSSWIVTLRGVEEELLSEWSGLGFDGRILVAGRLARIDDQLAELPVIYADQVFQLWASSGGRQLDLAQVWSVVRLMLVFDGEVELSDRVRRAIFGRCPGRRGKRSLARLWRGWSVPFRRSWLARQRWAKAAMSGNPKADLWSANYATDRMRAAGFTIQ